MNHGLCNRRTQWSASLLLVIASAVWAAPPPTPAQIATPAPTTQAPAMPSDIRHRVGIPDVLPDPPPQKAASNSTTKAGRDATDFAQKREALQMAMAKTEVSDGYMFIDADADWKNQSADWQRGQARQMVKKIKSSQPKANIQGVMIIDKDTREVVGQIKASDLN